MGWYQRRVHGERRAHTSPSPDRTRMRWSVVLVCILLLAVVAEGKKKKPSKGKKPGKKPSKPGVKGECDVGSPKLTVANTKKYTGTGKCACWWTSRGMTALAARKALGPCSAGSRCTSSATRSQTWAVLGCATTSTPSLGRATRASLTTPTRTARGATRTVGSASRTRSPDQTRRREAAAKQGRTRSTARPSKEIASISATVIQRHLQEEGQRGQVWTVLAVRVQQGIHWKRNPMHGRRWQPQCPTWPTSWGDLDHDSWTLRRRTC